jgi:hypothetical protein
MEGCAVLDTSQLSTVLAVVVAVVLAVSGVLDVWLYFTGGHDATVSAVVKDWSHRYPIIPLSVGMLIGHLFL